MSHAPPNAHAPPSAFTQLWLVCCSYEQQFQAGGLLPSRSFHTSTGSLGTGRWLVWVLLLACLTPSRWWSTLALLLLVHCSRACTSSPSEFLCCSGLCLTSSLLHVWQVVCICRGCICLAAWKHRRICYMLCSMFLPELACNTGLHASGSISHWFCNMSHWSSSILELH